MTSYYKLTKEKISLFEYIKQHMDKNGRLPDEFQQLPDEEESMQYWYKDNEELREINFAPGILNGNIGGFDVDTKKVIAEIFNRISTMGKVIESDDYDEKEFFYILDGCMGDIYEICMQNLTLSFIDDFIEEMIANQDKYDFKPLIQMVSLFYKEGAHREPVKFAIEILGLLSLANESEVFDNLMILGLSDELSKFVAMALVRQNQNELLFELAKRTTGWGKIEYVEKFEPQTEEEKLWLVTDGFRNDIMDEYLAYECAVKADLKNILQQTKSLDDNLYRGVKDIIEALLDDFSPREGIYDYDDGVFVIERFIEDSKKQASQLEDLYTIIKIFDFCKFELDNEESKYDKNIIQKIYNDTISIIRDDSFKWEEKIKNDPLHYASISAAPRLEIDIFDDLMEHAKKDINEAKFFDLVKIANEQRLEQVIKFAEENLPLDKIGTGVANELGLDGEFNLHMELNFLLQGLKKYPEKQLGDKLILTALKSPVVNNRNTAIRVLNSIKYKIDENHEIVKQVEENLQNDPNDDIKPKYKKFIHNNGLPGELFNNDLMRI